MYKIVMINHKTIPSLIVEIKIILALKFILEIYRIYKLLNVKKYSLMIR